MLFVQSTKKATSNVELSTISFCSSCCLSRKISIVFFVKFLFLCCVIAFSSFDTLSFVIVEVFGSIEISDCNLYEVSVKGFILPIHVFFWKLLQLPVTVSSSLWILSWWDKWNSWLSPVIAIADAFPNDDSSNINSSCVPVCPVCVRSNEVVALRRNDTPFLFLSSSWKSDKSSSELNLLIASLAEVEHLREFKLSS